MCNGLDILVNWVVDVVYVQKNYDPNYIYSFIIKEVLNDELIVKYKNNKGSELSNAIFNIDLENIYKRYKPCPKSLLAKKLKELG